MDYLARSGFLSVVGQQHPHLADREPGIIAVLVRLWGTGLANYSSHHIVPYRYTTSHYLQEGSHYLTVGISWFWE